MTKTAFKKAMLLPGTKKGVTLHSVHASVFLSIEKAAPKRSTTVTVGHAQPSGACAAQLSNQMPTHALTLLDRVLSARARGPSLVYSHLPCGGGAVLVARSWRF